jgi:MFS family permease
LEEGAEEPMTSETATISQGRGPQLQSIPPSVSPSKPSSRHEVTIKKEVMEKKDRHLIMLMVLIGVLMAVVDGSVVSIALPTITAYFHVNMAQSQWVMTGSLVTLTSLLLIFGKVSERTGKSKLFLSGFSLFTLSSLACGLATSLEMLILFRVVQALGAAMVFSISAAIIFQVSPPEERGRSMGYIGAQWPLEALLGQRLEE